MDSTYHDWYMCFLLIYGFHAFIYVLLFTIFPLSLIYVMSMIEFCRVCTLGLPPRF